MRKAFLTFILFVSPFFVHAQEPFITTWLSTEGYITIHNTPGLEYNYNVDFGDGTIYTNVTESITHNYENTGEIYTVSISGIFPHFRWNSNPGARLLSIEQWGDIEWKDMSWSFAYANYVSLNAVDTPDLSQVTSMANMFFKVTQGTFNESISNWDVSNVTNMQMLFYEAYLFNQPLDSWDVSNVTNMKSMFNMAYSFNQPLNNWNVSNVTEASRMFKNATSFNQPLDSWDVSNVQNFLGMFEEAYSFNQDLSNWELNLGLSNFLNWTAMSVENYNSLLTRIATLGMTAPSGSPVLGALGLKHCNQGAHSYITDVLNWEIQDHGLSEDCNAIVGSVSLDINNNGCDLEDLPVNGLFVMANDGTFDFGTIVTNGNYYLGVSGISFTVSMNVPEYYTVTPESANVIFSGSNTEIVDFCLTANQSVEDLNITILPINEARPGFESDYRLVIRNVGTEIISNTVVTFTFDNAMQQFVSATPNPDATTGNSLTFNLGEILPFGITNIDVTMETFQPPIVEGGDILNFTAVVLPDANDYTPEDNTYLLEQIVVNSFDPNDKLVLQGDEVHINDVHKYLDYIIRFQNTGTASAVNVRILDTLHPKLNYNTFTPISASHDYYIQITNQNQVEFIFNNIHLPHEGANEPESHGFVAFKIKPKSDVQVGDIISGDAAIYFDFNPSIITDMVYTEIVDFMDVSDPEHIDNGVSVFPNPTKNLIHIKLNRSLLMKEVIMYNIQGHETLRSFEKDISIENLESGIYILKILTNQGNVFRKVVKQ